jgi:hypothetical protein
LLLRFVASTSIPKSTAPRKHSFFLQQQLTALDNIHTCDGIFYLNTLYTNLAELTFCIETIFADEKHDVFHQRWIFKFDFF